MDAIVIAIITVLVLALAYQSERIKMLEEEKDA